MPFSEYLTSSGKTLAKQAVGKKRNAKKTVVPVLTPDRFVFVQEMILKLRAALLHADPTITSISIDGDSASYSWETAHKLLRQYEQEEKILSGQFSAMETIDMSRM